MGARSKRQDAGLVVLAVSSCRTRPRDLSLLFTDSLYLFAAISSCDIPVHPNDVSLRVTVDKTRWIHSADNTHATVSASLSFSRLSIALSPLSLTLLTLFVAPVAYRLFSCTRVETDAGSLRRSFDRYDEIARHDRSHVTGYGSRVNTYEILDTP